MAQKTRRISHGVAVSTLFSAISLLYGSAAYGGFYPGHIDPGGTSTVPAFTGDAVFDIPSTCFHEGVNITGSLGCGTAMVYSALIDLYMTDPAVPPAFPNDVPIGHFSLTPIDSWNISRIFVSGGALAGVETGQMGPNPGTDGWAGRNFWLDFDCDDCFSDPAYIYINQPGFPEVIGDISNPGIVTFGPACREVNGVPVDCVVTATPEPGTLALLFGALGGGWLARRRKAKLKA